MFNRVRSYNRCAWKRTVGNGIRKKFGYSAYQRSKRNYRRAVGIKSRRNTAARRIQSAWKRGASNRRWIPGGLFARKLAARFRSRF